MYFMRCDLSQRVGKKIKQLREEKGYSQNELAKMMGYQSRASVSYMETGTRSIYLRDLSRLCEIFEVDVLKFFDDERV